MFTNWKPKLAVVSTFLLGFITWLGFFDVNAKTIKEQMTAHYLFLIAAIVFTMLFILAIRYWWRNSRPTPDNIRQRVREWLDELGLPQRLVPWQPWHFGYEITHPGGPVLFVARPTAAPDNLIFTTRIQGMWPPQRIRFNALSEDEKQRLYAEIQRESARAKINFFSERDYELITISKSVPISKRLTALTFLEYVNEIHFSANIFWATIALHLGPANPTQSSPPPDTEACPPSPTS